MENALDLAAVPILLIAILVVLWDTRSSRTASSRPAKSDRDSQDTEP